MNRVYYVAGWGYAAISLAFFLRMSGPVGYALAREPVTEYANVEATEGGRWFMRVKPHCNALEADLAIRRDPPPATVDGAGYEAACQAVAGRIESARAVLLRLPERERAGAAGLLFGVGHPIADAGDDRSAGPIMRLVVDFQPWNTMALYHAGMSYYILGDDALARRYLRDFTRMYEPADGWRANALDVLDRLGGAADR
jgi:hypothetical protein